MQTPIYQTNLCEAKKSLTICLARHRWDRPHRGSGHRDTLQGPALQGQLCSPYSHIHFQMMHLQEYNRSRDLLNRIFSMLVPITMKISRRASRATRMNFFRLFFRSTSTSSIFSDVFSVFMIRAEIQSLDFDQIECSKVHRTQDKARKNGEVTPSLTWSSILLSSSPLALTMVARSMNTAWISVISCSNLTMSSCLAKQEKII